MQEVAFGLFMANTISPKSSLSHVPRLLHGSSLAYEGLDALKLREPLCLCDVYTFANGLRHINLMVISHVVLVVGLGGYFAKESSHW